MTYDADAITARRKLRRSVTLWRVLAVLGGLFALGAIILAASGGVLDRRGDHIARIEVDGLITGDAKTLKMLEQIEKADRVKALIVSIDSPGGTTAGSEAIYEWLRKIAAKKPVVSTMGTVAASGGYITAIGTDYIVARGNTITGSIGVIFQWADLEKLLQTVGVQMEEVKSGELKAEPNFFGPPSEKVLAVTNEMVQDSYRWFTGLVHERRGIEEQKIVDMQGRVFTGRQALKENSSTRSAARRSRSSGFRTRRRCRSCASSTGSRTTASRASESSRWRAPGSNSPASRRWRNSSTSGPKACTLTVSCRFGRLAPETAVTAKPITFMIKSELIQAIAESNPHLYHRDVERIINVIFDEIIGALAAGDRVELRGFGAFSVKTRNARQGRNPRTGDQVPVKAKSIPFFKTGKELRDRLNNGEG